MIDKNIIPIVLIKDEKSHMYIPQHPNGYNNLLLPSEVDNIIDGLFMYRGTYSDDDILQYNERNEKNFFRETKSTKRKVNKCHEGYVYILKCDNHYKVGFSKDVQRRIKQLDTRPFELKLVKQYYSTNAYDIEQAAHKQLERYKVANEWYNVDINYIISAIERGARALGCDIQY